MSQRTKGHASGTPPPETLSPEDLSRYYDWITGRALAAADADPAGPEVRLSLLRAVLQHAFHLRSQLPAESRRKVARQLDETIAEHGLMFVLQAGRPFDPAADRLTGEEADRLFGPARNRPRAPAPAPDARGTRT